MNAVPKLKKKQNQKNNLKKSPAKSVASKAFQWNVLMAISTISLALFYLDLVNHKIFSLNQRKHSKIERNI